MVDGEVGRHAQLSQCAQHNRGPTVKDLAGDEIGGRVVGVAVGVEFFAHDDNDTDLDGGIDGFHLLNVIHSARGVGVGIVRGGVVIGFRHGGILFVAYLPILEAVMIGHVRPCDPRRRLGGRAGAVIGGNDDRGSYVGGDLGETGKGVVPLIGGVVVISVGIPMIIIGI